MAAHESAQLYERDQRLVLRQCMRASVPACAGGDDAVVGQAEALPRLAGERLLQRPQVDPQPLRVAQLAEVVFLPLARARQPGRVVAVAAEVASEFCGYAHRRAEVRPGLV